MGRYAPVLSWSCHPIDNANRELQAGEIMNTYSEDYYKNRHKRTIYSANVVLSMLLEQVPKIQSAVDIGCGVGTWLSVLQEKGVKEIEGLDGKWVDQDLLEIPKDCFIPVDLGKMPIQLPQRYDLAISLEVAEHLSPELTDGLVSSLAGLADYVLFSAAIPFQGGRRHVNEQWQHYWVEKFRASGYEVYDFIRPKIWTDPHIPFPYRQNILFFSKYPIARKATDGDACTMPLDLVHPDNLTQMGIRGSFALFLRSLKKRINRIIGRRR